MTGSQLARFFVADWWIIADESTNAWSSGDKMDADAPAHAVSNHCAALAVDVVSSGQIAPGSVDDLYELSIGGFLLCFVHAVRFAEHLIEVGYDCCITELREVTDIDLHIPGDPEMVMNDQHAGAGLPSVRLRDISRDAVFLGTKIAVNDLHRLRHPRMVVSISRWIKL